MKPTAAPAAPVTAKLARAPITVGDSGLPAKRIRGGRQGVPVTAGLAKRKVGTVRSFIIRVHLYTGCDSLRSWSSARMLQQRYAGQCRTLRAYSLLASSVAVGPRDHAISRETSASLFVYTRTSTGLPVLPLGVPG